MTLRSVAFACLRTCLPVEHSPDLFSAAQFLGQSVTFEFPFFYNYSTAFTCEGDSVPYYKLLQRVAAKCPKLREVKVNMEMFVERLNNGLHVRA